jgi:6,7-dimethyl-8-ribityllumazine synthase
VSTAHSPTARLLEPFDFSNTHIIVLTSRWHGDITARLRAAAIGTLTQQGVDPQHIHSYDVPGSYELTSAAHFFAQAGHQVPPSQTSPRCDAIICLGCVVKGETRHDEYINHAVAQGIQAVSLQYNIPVVFGVLTTDTIEQANDRAGAKFPNQGHEYALAALEMLSLKQQAQRLFATSD